MTCGALCARRKWRNGGSDASVASHIDPTPIGACARPRRTAKLKRHFAILALFVSLAVAPKTAAAQENLTVFAAASMRNALDEADAAFTKATGIKVTASYAATSALTKQIEQGAPADVFVSADLKWMDYAIQYKLVKEDSRVNLLGNRLVLIAPKASKLDHVAIDSGFDIARLAGDGRIAVADTMAVPAGRYAQAALTSLGAWKAAEPKLAQAENVRAALAYVARGEAPLGIVYETDAKIEPGVKIVGVFPAGSHPAITYPVAATSTTRNTAVTRYLRFLRTESAKAIFEKYGFSFLIKPVS
jgi:molybdate transport system substrate-binding protein